ncbi:MAG: hypothetical protein BGP06_10515 [Rhizobiales bacterium 65-9]|nr:MAG: hypothetical protein BGP06_10515 [Rhizobiales bacterium 65-9]
MGRRLFYAFRPFQPAQARLKARDIAKRRRLSLGGPEARRRPDHALKARAIRAGVEPIRRADGPA